MSESLTDLIFSLTPEDGSAIGNGAMMALLRERMPSLADDDYLAARDALVSNGLLARGRGRGGSIFRVLVGPEDDEEEESWGEDEDDEADGFELTLTEEPAPQHRKTAARKNSPRKLDGPAQVLSYRHGETRVNNPEVGMVHAGTDPDGEKIAWAYDPHLDPVLNFDSARAGIERLIDDALTSDDPARMRDALMELKRLQAPYLNWTGKAERTSVEVETVSLHVHERVDTATILANAAKRLEGKDAATQWRQPDLFAAPFENLPLRKALDFYHHEKGWSNRLKNNHPGLLDEMRPEPRHAIAIQRNRKRLPNGVYALNASGPLLNRAILGFAAKLCCAMRYDATGIFMPNEGAIEVRWINNYQAFMDEYPPSIHKLFELGQTLRQGTKHVGEQFRHSFRIRTEKPVSYHIGVFRESFAVYGIATDDVGLLDPDNGANKMTRFRPGWLKDPVDTGSGFGKAG